MRSTPHTGWGLELEDGRAEEEEADDDDDEVKLLVGRLLEVEEKVMVDWVEERVLEDRTLEVERMSDGRLENVDERLEPVEDRLEAVDEMLGTVEERLGTVEDRLGTVDERLEDRLDDRLETVENGLGTVDERLATVEDELGITDEGWGLAGLEDDGADEDAALEAWEELGAAELEGPDELAAPVDRLEAAELELAPDGRAEEADIDAVLDRMDETMELMLDRTALLVIVLTGTNEELTLSTEVITDDEAGAVGAVVLVFGVVVVVGLLVVDDVVLATKPLLADVTVTPLTVTVVGNVTLAVDTVTVVLPATVVVTAGAVHTEEKHEHAADTAGMARPTRATWAKAAKSTRARSSRSALSSSPWGCSLR